MTTGHVESWKKVIDMLDKTKDGLPVYHAVGFGTSWKEIKDDMFYFVTGNTNTGTRRVFKLMRTDTAQECRECPLRKYRCGGVGCHVREVM